MDLAIVTAAAYPNAFYWEVARSISAVVVECTAAPFAAMGGHTIHANKSSSTGYTGVVFEPTLSPADRPYLALGPEEQKLGYFATALDAAVAISRVISAPAANGSQCHKWSASSREAQAYVSYIAHNYDVLPARIAFLHGQNVSWHHTDPLWTTRIAAALRDSDAEYVHLGEMATCTSSFDQTDWCEDAWPVVFEPHLHRPCPRALCTFKGAEFIASRAAIQRRPRAFYLDLHDLISGTGSIGARTVNSSHSPNGRDLAHAHLFEWVHHLILGQPDRLPAAAALANASETNLSAAYHFGPHLAFTSRANRIMAAWAEAYAKGNEPTSAAATPSILAQLLAAILAAGHLMLPVMTLLVVALLARRMHETARRKIPAGGQRGFRVGDARAVRPRPSEKDRDE